MFPNERLDDIENFLLLPPGQFRSGLKGLVEFAARHRYSFGRSFTAQLSYGCPENRGKSGEAFNVNRHGSPFEIGIRLLGDSESFGDMSLREACGLAQLDEPAPEVISFADGWASLWHVAIIRINTGITGKGLHEYRNKP